MICETRPLAGVNDAIAEVLQGEAKARLGPRALAGRLGPHRREVHVTQSPNAVLAMGRHAAGVVSETGPLPLGLGTGDRGPGEPVTSDRDERRGIGGMLLAKA